jgi:hypothetical protein
MVKGRLDDMATTATGYAWFVWEKNLAGRRALCGFHRVGSSLSARAIMTCPDSWVDLEQEAVCRSAERELLNTRRFMS